MASGEEYALGDPAVFPDDSLVSSLIGEQKNHWDTIINYLSANYTGSETVWNYYNDGKQWLFRALYRKKTVFWAAVLKNDFRITFYFGDRAEPVIMQADLPEGIKSDFKSGKHFGKIRAITMPASGIEDVSVIFRLIDLKIKVK